MKKEKKTSVVGSLSFKTVEREFNVRVSDHAKRFGHLRPKKTPKLEIYLGIRILLFFQLLSLATQLFRVTSEPL